MRQKLMEILRNNFFLCILTVLMAVLGGYYVWRHRRPFTQNAFVVANTRPVSALVGGYLEHIHVKNNQFVRKGDLLFTIFRRPYELKVKELESSAESINAREEALHAALKVQEAQVRSEKARQANALYLAERAAAMYEASAVSQTYAEERTRELEISGAELSAAELRLGVIRAELKQLEAEKKKIRHSLALAKVYLEQTLLTALSDGFIINMYLSPGGYYHAGDVFCAFVDNSGWFVQANFEETDLSKIREGQAARVWLWQYPGKCFSGVVDRINWGVDRRLTSDGTGAAVVEKENQWFMLPQRFPVIIRLDELPDETYPLHIGGSAYVEIETSSQFFKQILWRIYQWSD